MEKDVQRAYEVIIGIILILPALFSVFLFFVQLVGPERMKGLNKFLDTFWTGTWGGYGDMASAGYTSALPFYFGLMAIAGAYLIKDNKK